jgi:multiple sugar transport system ATP-binding protein
VASFIGSPPMNLVEARIEGRNGSLVASFGDQELPVPDAPGQSRPGLSRYEGRTIALGVRPHNFEDAALARDAPARLRGTVQITESLGSELVAYVSMRGKAVHHEAVIEGAVYEAEEQVSVEEISVGMREGETTWCASLDPTSRASEGEAIELAVDTRKLHFFDLESGQTIA